MNSVPTSMIPPILRRKKTGSKGWDNRGGRFARSMKTYLPLGILAALLLAALILLVPSSAQSTKQISPNALAVGPSFAAPPKPTLTHAQTVWKSALEWCESNGKKDAVNPVDRDGTPSYYSFQFKPSTFAAYAAKYGIEGDISDYEAQSAIVTGMILDESLGYDDWRYREFPGCVAKLGAPPR